MELKWVYSFIVFSEWRSFNCTFMELKLIKAKADLKNQAF